MINKTQLRKLMIEQDKPKWKTNVIFSATFASSSFEDKLNWNQRLVIANWTWSLWCGAADKVWITELTLIHKNFRSVRNSYAKVYQSIWRSRPIGLADILAIMSVSTFKIDVILYLLFVAIRLLWVAGVWILAINCQYKQLL